MNWRDYLKPLVLSAFMLLAVGVATIATPTLRLADQRPKVELETMVPLTFGEWRIDPSVIPVTVSPEVQAALDKLYNQTISRTYVNGKGERVMLSLAYGADQSDNVSVHLPEGCYYGQGFSVGAKTKAILQTAFGELPVARLVATKGPRFEPITYWVVVGAEATTDTWEMKKAKLRYALRGEIADGLLVRISTLSPDAPRGYSIQREFADAMLGALSPESRSRFLGS